MNEREVQRRLSAVLAADVVGYTSLMEADTDATVAAWQTARAEIVDPAIAGHSGRIVKHTGDGFLAEFPSIQDAVRCALALQQQLAGSPLDFRMGVNFGDIVDDGEDIHGEGVNIAARIEGLADPGGICISGGVSEQIRTPIAASYQDIGEQQVKHVSAPVRVYRLAPAGQTAKPPPKTQPVTSEADGKNLDRDLRLGGVITLFVAPGLIVLGWFADALKPMLGVAALVAFVAIGLLLAARMIERR